MPAANTGMHVKGMPVHVPIGGVFVNPPSNEGTIITGSKTVHVLGTSGARLTSMVITCNDPINLPTSVVMSIPMGAPVFTGGPTAVDWMAVALSAIRTKWVSDKLHDLLGAEPGSWRSKIICFFTGHPVEVVSGRVMTDALDFELHGLLPIKFERNYYSASNYEGPLGHGWHHSYDQYISVDAQNVCLRLPDGRPIAVDEIAVGEEFFEPIERLSISRGIDSFTVRRADRQTLSFGPELPNGRFPLVRIEDSNGNAIHLGYKNGYLVSITDHRGRCVRLELDDAGRIVALMAPHPKQATTELEVARFVYDSVGDLVQVYDALGNAYEYEYSGHRLIRETNRNGRSFYFEYDSDRRDARCVHTWGDEGIYDHKLTFYPAAHITIVEDSLGAKTTYHSNDAGLVTQVTDALGGSWNIGWDRFCHKVFERDPEGNTRHWEYDFKGNLIRHRNALGGETRLQYDGQGRVTRITDPVGQGWAREYDIRGNVIKCGLEGDPPWNYHYDALGNIVMVTDPLGFTQRLGYDNFGLLASVIDSDGNVTRLERNRLGRLIAEQDALGVTKRFDYDALGRLLRIYVSSGLDVRIAYDPQGNVTERVSGNRGTFRYEYGAHNRLKRIQQPSGRSFRFAYDPELRLTGVENGNGETWAYKYDSVGHVVEETDFYGRVLRYQYDRAGGLRKRTNGAGEITEFQRNPLGQPVLRQSSDGARAEFRYDANGYLCSARNQSKEVFFERDGYGRILREVQGDHFIESTFDKRGFRIKRRTSSGRQMMFAYEGNGKLKSLTADTGEGLEFARDVNGRETGRKLKNPRSIDAFDLRFEYDEQSRLTRQSATASLGQPGLDSVSSGTQFRYDEGGNLTAKVDSKYGLSEYQYDSDGRLLSVDRSEDRGERFVYDEAGNLREILSEGSHGKRLKAIRQQFGPDSELEFASDRIVFFYDADGRIVEKRDVRGAWKYEWTTEGHLRSLQTPKGETWTYEYDAFGRRVCKIGPHGRTTYVWDGVVIAEECREPWGREGLSTWIFEPDSFRPLAKEENGKFYTCVTDQLGTPRELVTNDGTVGWSAQLSTWGEVEILDSTRTDCPIGFPGQWRDRESGLAYNFFRYYDPQTGSYLSRDPLGLFGGTRPYGYVQNPLRWIDPLGLARGDPLPGSETINRIGGGDASNLALKEAEKSLKPPGISVLTGEDADAVAEAFRKAFPNAEFDTIGTATVAEVREAGFDVIEWGTKNLPNHARLIHPDGVEGFSAENLDELSKKFKNKGC
jgi:RHS repeat-associated protein